jgi:hypothetical protein
MEYNKIIIDIYIIKLCLTYQREIFHVNIILNEKH